MNKQVLFVTLNILWATVSYGQKQANDTLHQSGLLGSDYIMPYFHNSADSLEKYIAQNLFHCPIIKIQGKVIVRFVVNEQGDISNATIVRSIHSSCDSEALWLVQSMPKWHPATYKNKPTKAIEFLPISFLMK